MHDDFLGIREYITGGGLLQLPDGYEWAEGSFVSVSGGWAAVYRPLNLGLAYISRDAFLAGESALSDRDGSIFKKFLDEGIIQSSGSSKNEEILGNLRRQADSGVFRFICILPTNRCEMKCAYCHQRVKPQEQRDMTPEEVRRGMQKCAELCSDISKPADILIYGGEPLLNFPATEEVFRLARGTDNIFRQEVRLAFTTSGWGMTGRQAKVLAEHDVFVIVSVDGSSEINDSIRKSKEEPASFAAAARAIRLLKAEGCRTGISVTIGKHNFADIGRQVEYLISEFQPQDIGLNTFLHPVNGRSNPYQLEWREAYEALLAGFRAARQYGVYAEQPFRRLKPFVNRKPLLKDCSSPGERLVLVPGGKIGFCDSCYPAGEYFYDVEDFPGMCAEDYAKWRRLSAVKMPECSRCPAMTVCGGACRFDAYQASGRLDGVEMNRCRFERGFLRFMIWELFSLLNCKDEGILIPDDEDRRKLIENFAMGMENQPFLAGTYSDSPEAQPGSP